MTANRGHPTPPPGRNRSVTQNPTDGPIHEYFELTYADHLVKNRTLLQSMPLWWQEEFVPLLRLLDAAFEHVQKPDGYRVTAGKWMQLHDMTESQLNAARFVVEGDDEDGPGEDTRYYREFDGAELTGSDYGFVPGRNPIPHYRHAYIEPRLPEVEGDTSRPELRIPDHVVNEEQGPGDEETFCSWGEGDAPGSGCILPAGHEPANRHLYTPGDGEFDL